MAINKISKVDLEQWLIEHDRHRKSELWFYDWHRWRDSDQAVSQLRVFVKVLPLGELNDGTLAQLTAIAFKPASKYPSINNLLNVINQYRHAKQQETRAETALDEIPTISVETVKAALAEIPKLSWRQYIWNGGEERLVTKLRHYVQEAAEVSETLPEEKLQQTVAIFSLAARIKVATACTSLVITASPVIASQVVVEEVIPAEDRETAARKDIIIAFRSAIGVYTSWSQVDTMVEQTRDTPVESLYACLQESYNASVVASKHSDTQSKVVSETLVVAEEFTSIDLALVDSTTPLLPCVTSVPTTSSFSFWLHKANTVATQAVNTANIVATNAANTTSTAVANMMETTGASYDACASSSNFYLGWAAERVGLKS